jgi:hypothetical protein
MRNTLLIIFIGIPNLFVFLVYSILQTGMTIVSML